MIGTFWNLCRACPSMPIDKKRSEYRSTYQWYEYTGHRQEIVKQAPQLTSPTKPEENELKGGIQATLININKKEGTKLFKENAGEGTNQPDVNIKRNPIFEAREGDFPVADFTKTDPPTRTTANPGVRVRSRNDRRDYAPSRRSKSEGPPGGTSGKRSYILAYGSPSPEYADFSEFDAADYVLISNYPDDCDADTAGIPLKGSRGNTEYRLQFAWPKAKNASDAHEEQLKAAGAGSRRSAFMAPASYERPPVPVHKKRFLDADKKDTGAAELEPLVDQNGECEHNDEKNEKIQRNNDRIEFYSEYQKKFRPFSQYDYIAGKFLARDNAVAPASNLSSGSWYAEVLELRKKAGEYRHRGWGTELVPQHLAEVYNKQIALWEHVSRRSSLSALTLATTTQKPRALTKEEKSKENNRKLGPYKLRETRQASVDRTSAVLRKKTEKNEEIKRHSSKLSKDGVSKYNAEKSSSTAGTPLTPVSTARSQPAAVNGSPKKHVARSSSTGSPKKGVSSQSESRPRPTTLATSAHSRNKRDSSVSAKKKESLKLKASPVTATKASETKKSEETSTNVEEKTEAEESEKLENEPDEPIIDVEHIVKSPPEPTRVKSPEQMIMKSPEPVNWTVPLDTGRTFTVTQNIHDAGDMYHHRPPTDTKLHHVQSHLTDNQDTSSLKTEEGPASISSIDQMSDKPRVTEPHVNGIESRSTDHSIEEPTKAVDLPSTSGTSISENDDLMNGKKSSPIPQSAIDDTKLKSVDHSTVPSDNFKSAQDAFDQLRNTSPLNGKESSM